MDFISESPLKEPLIFDTHSHYDDERFSEYGEQFLYELHQNGVGKIITCGCNSESSKSALEIAEKYDFVYAACGLHPCDIKDNPSLDFLPDLLKAEKCVALGEIGLDYYWESDNKELQKDVFKKQLIISNEMNIPVLVHDRDAHSDTLEILKHYKPSGVVHSFSGSLEMAEEILKLGMYIGVGGVITFSNAKKLPDIVKAIPLDRILLETDAPYLAPVPYRGKTNHSGMIYFTAQKIAEIKELDIETVLKETYNNASKLFDI